MPGRRAELRCQTGLRGGLAAALLTLLLPLLAACATPTVAPPGPLAAEGGTEPSLAAKSFAARDGLRLPLRTWLPEETPRAVFLALHGFNDYSKAFEAPGEAFAEHGIAVYAFDQRGFGEAPNRGLWPGVETMGRDVADLAGLLRKRHPGVPLYLLGESMGGALIMAIAGGPEAPSFDGLILSSPAVWARETMPFHQRALLWIGERLIPWAKFTGRGLGYQASDNIEALRANGRDPLFIKETRVSAMGGLVDLMSEALEAGPRFRRRALVLYGEKDEIIPRPPTLRLWRSLPGAADGRQRRALYPKGWHMLLRDLEAEIVLADILAWIGDAEAPLPSAADRSALVRLGGLGEG